MSVTFSIPSPSGRPPSSGGGGNISQRLWSAQRTVLHSPASALNRSIPSNPRYLHVKATVQTGKHVNNLKPKLDRSGELFHRISCQSLDRWMNPVKDSEDESIFQWDEQQVTEKPAPSATQITPASASAPSSARASSVSAASARSSSARSHEPENESPPSSRHARHTASESFGSSLPPFLLCDCRSSEEFECGHIEGATSLPIALIRRDQFSSMIYSACKRESVPLIVYDEDAGKLGIEAANLLCQKLFPKVYFLSGGLKAFAEKFPKRIAGKETTDITRTTKNGVLQNNLSISNQARKNEIPGRGGKK